jgi:hypothetical protein
MKSKPHSSQSAPLVIRTKLGTLGVARTISCGTLVLCRLGKAKDRKALTSLRRRSYGWHLRACLMVQMATQNNGDGLLQNCISDFFEEKQF